MKIRLGRENQLIRRIIMGIVFGVENVIVSGI